MIIHFILIFYGVPHSIDYIYIYSKFFILLSFKFAFNKFSNTIVYIL